MSGAYESVIGLEIHVQLRTRSKMFCGCGTGFGAEPNAQVCPVCLGYPGAMPTMNAEAVRLTVKAGLALGCAIPAQAKFDRKSYFYPDMPKNYQISQYDQPLCVGGELAIADGAGGERVVRLERIHLEEDVAKSVHFASCSGVDFNRAGTPLMEIVTKPDMHSADEAFAFLHALKEVLRYTEVSDCNLEEGNIRCDVNCSVRPAGQAALGTKTELKNLNTFKGVQQALEYEIARQIEVVAGGGRVVQETRRWDADRGMTFAMRSKEDAHDYRYFPEPDLLPVALEPAAIARWRAELPELPRARRARLVAEYGIPVYDAGVLVADRAIADFFEATARACGNGKAASNWVMGDLLRELGERAIALADARVTPERLAELIRLQEAGTINSNTARDVFAVMVAEGVAPAAYVAEKGLGQVRDDDALARMVEEALAANPKSVADYRAGKTAAAKFLVGQVMKLSRGKADPLRVAALLADRLG